MMLSRKRPTQLIYSFIKIVSITFVTIVFLLILQNIFLKIKTNDFVILNISNVKNAMFTGNLTSIRSFVQEMNKQFLSLSNSTLINEKKSYETTIRCVGSLSNQSCLFQNLYYINSEFIIITVKGKDFPSYSVRTNAFWQWPTVIKKREFDSYSNLEKFVRTVMDPKVFPSVTLYFVQDWHYNIGHALFDGLYPAYVALIRFPPRHLQPFRILTELRDCQACWSEDIYNRFSGLGIVKESILREMSKRKWFMFDEIIMGSGTMCQRCTQPNLQLAAGVELDASRLFRDRMYQHHGLIQPIIRQKSSSEDRTSHDILRAYIIHNKRFTEDDQYQITNAIMEINNYTQTVDKTTKFEWPLVHVSYLYYNTIKAQHLNSSLIDPTSNNFRSTIYEFIENNFIAQLRILRQMDIHIAGPGTGQMYQTFLSDGSVHINLGGLKQHEFQTTENAFTSFGEQYMTSGTPYIKGLYYPINQRPTGIKKDEVIKLIRQAAQLILQGFSLPVNPRENLAADGKLFVEVCEKDKQFCSLVTTRASTTNFECLNFWIEELVHEHRQWKMGGIIDNNKNISCYYNHTLLHELREKYGIQYTKVDD